MLIPVGLSLKLYHRQQATEEAFQQSTRSVDDDKILTKGLQELTQLYILS